MKTLIIKDLPRNEELDAKAMASVLGGNLGPGASSASMTAQRVPVPPYERGYLVGWVINTADRPIKFDALIGDAVLRATDGATSAYNGIPIQVY
ncbi:hypothetical protein [Noviherbaspirillum saxi]|uniref:Uncharacterized protein n=1 Tax=Noviherbaspirillum saxi TaxID=2320863 RepID=A0A3A3FN34_9BURK|nr:hypothetical protein [Noviherbaspirillum saxi]RJF95069.1 hypothetical protein D3871_16525 [Noviherbaspirillum saxi]